MENIDIEKLRKDLIDYFGSAMFINKGLSIMELSNIENASDNELIDIAIKNNFNLNNYIKENYKKF